MKLVLKKKSSYSYDPWRDGVSQSMLGQWLECREKSRLKLLQGLTPKGTSVPFTYGSISHGVVERCYEAMQSGKVRKLDDAYSNLHRWMGEAEEDWKKENPRSNSDALEIVEESCAILLEVLPRYFKFWWEKDIAVEWTHVEEKFEVPIDVDLQGTKRKTVMLVGRFDGVFKRKGKQYLLETKNKGRWSDRMMEYLPLDLQLGTYLTALAHTTQEDPHEVCYNVLRRPQERRTQKESLQQFAWRVGENIAKDPKHYFQRFEIRLERKEKEEAKFRIEKLVSEFCNWWLREDHSERDLMWNSGSCDGKYGVCSELAICANGDKSGHYIRAAASPELVSD